MRGQAPKKVRLSVRFVSGQWQLESGGAIPVEDGTKAELVVFEHKVTDDLLKKKLREKSYIPIFKEGTRLRVLLATKSGEDLTPKQVKHLVPLSTDDVQPIYVDDWNSRELSFVEITVGKPGSTQQTKFRSDGGGIWLCVKGDRADGLISSELILPDPIKDANAQSLNHAFTLLSEIYEPWRISHTGNVYKRFFYKEGDGLWYPLELLRDASLVQKEHEIAQEFWGKFNKRLSSE